MEPKSFGRKLGIGVRVAGNVARERAQEAAARRAARPTPDPVPGSARSALPVSERGRNLGQGIGRGTRQFSQAFFRPLAHVGSVLWLEITGCFFALFAAFFAQNVYRLRAQAVSGAEHQTFLVYCVLTALFLYFSLSSFVRAHRRSRKRGHE